MPNKTKADLIIHPVRLGILQALSASPLSTQEIAQAMPGVALPSLYRHLKLLLEGKMVEVVETRTVRAIPEKIYRLAQALVITAEDVNGMSPDDLIHYFTSYTASLLQGFADYANDGTRTPNMYKDYAGFTETYFYASDEEMEKFFPRLGELIKEIASNDPSENRRRRKLAIINHPIK